MYISTYVKQKIKIYFGMYFENNYDVTKGTLLFVSHK